jgi:outer membrane protein assembly factor BamB
MARGRAALGLAALMVGAGLSIVAPRAGAARGPCEWPQYGHDPGHSFAQSPECSDVNRRSATRLVPKWVFPTADSVSASPAVVDGTVYVGTWDGRFYALPTDPPLGLVKPRWVFRVDDTNGVAFGRISSSAAVVKVAGRRVVVFGGGATLYVLDAANGHKLASLCLDPRDDPAVRCKGSREDIEILSSPAVIPDADGALVVVGMDVHNADNVGRTGVVAMRLHTAPWSLDPLWKFDPEARVALDGPDLLTQGAGTGAGCSSVWGSPAVDAAAGLVFFGTGSCGDPSPAGQPAKGGESVFAVRLADGGLQWWYDASEPVIDYDDDFGASANLLPGGRVGIGGKDGWYYAFARNGDGRPLWKTHAGQAGHLSTGFAIGGMIGSAATGRVKGEPAVFATTAISTPIGEPYDVKFGDIDKTLLRDPGRMLSLHAMSAIDGRILWRAPIARASYGAASYANGVVFMPSTFDFSINAFDANTGLPLWVFPLHGPPSSTPVVVGDSLYVGTGTRTTDLEYKLTDGNTLSPLSPLSGVYGFELVP